MVALALLAVGMGISAQLAKRAEQQRRSEAEGLMDFMLGDFADKLRPLGRLDLLESVSGKALQYLSGSDGAELSQAALTLRAKGLQTISEVSRSRGDSKQALDALQRARAILTRQLERAPNDVQVLKNLGANAYWVAMIHNDRNDWQAADNAARDYLLFADRLNRIDPDNPEWWVEQSYANNNLGSLAQNRGQPALAAPYFAASISLKQRALARTPAGASSSVAAELADSFSWLAWARESLGELAAAETLYAQEMSLVQELRQRFPSDAMWTYREVRALHHRAAIRVALGLDDRALQDYASASRLFAPIVDQDKKNRAWQVEFAALEQDRLRILARHVSRVEIRPALTSLQHRFHALLQFDPTNSSWAEREAVARIRMAEALDDGGMALSQVDAAMVNLQSLLDKNPSNLNTKMSLIDGYLLRAKIQQTAATGDYLLSCQKARGIIDQPKKDTNNYKVLDSWVRINFCLRNPGEARSAVERLHAMGYRDSQYLRLVSN